MDTINLSKRQGTLCISAVDQDVNFLLKIPRILWKNPMVVVLSTRCVFVCIEWRMKATSGAYSSSVASSLSISSLETVISFSSAPSSSSSTSSRYSYISSPLSSTFA